MAGSFQLSAMGMFVEAIDLVAAVNGLKLKTYQHGSAADLAAIISRPMAPGLIPFARIELVPAPDAQLKYEVDRQGGLVRARASRAERDHGGSIAQAVCMMPSAMAAALPKRERRVAAGMG
jgi:hypothetical protein